MAKRNSNSTQQGVTIGGLVLVLIAVVIMIFQNLSGDNAGVTTPPTRVSGNAGPTVATGQTTNGGLPEMPDKPKPRVGTYKGCPPEGDGGDPAMNRFKNRTDEAEYVPVDFDAVFDLTWPKDIERRNRDRWSTEDTATIAQYEGLPISIEGYLVQGRESGEESPNCHGTANDEVDWHVWMTKKTGEDRTKSIVIETTPRVRAQHPNWSLRQVSALARDGLRVRISGWLFMDPEHPDQIGKTRGTIWEIHPIMEMEVQVDGAWVSLDEWQP